MSFLQPKIIRFQGERNIKQLEMNLGKSEKDFRWLFEAGRMEDQRILSEKVAEVLADLLVNHVAADNSYDSGYFGVPLHEIQLLTVLKVLIQEHPHAFKNEKAEAMFGASMEKVKADLVKKMDQYTNLRYPWHMLENHQAKRWCLFYTRTLAAFERYGLLPQGFAQEQLVQRWNPPIRKRLAEVLRVTLPLPRLALDSGDTTEMQLFTLEMLEAWKRNTPVKTAHALGTWITDRLRDAGERLKRDGAKGQFINN